MRLWPGAEIGMKRRRSTPRLAGMSGCLCACVPAPKLECKGMGVWHGSKHRLAGLTAQARICATLRGGRAAASAEDAAAAAATTTTTNNNNNNNNNNNHNSSSSRISSSSNNSSSSNSTTEEPDDTAGAHLRDAPTVVVQLRALRMLLPATPPRPFVDAGGVEVSATPYRTSP
jgi:hypothetical protein